MRTLLRVTPLEAQPRTGRPGCAKHGRIAVKQMPARTRRVHMLESRERSAIKQRPAMLTSRRTDVHDPVSATDHIQIVLDYEERITGRLQSHQRIQQRLGVSGCRPADGSSSTYTTPKRLLSHLRGEAQPLQLPGRKRGRGSLERQVAQAEVEQDRRRRDHVGGDALGHDGFLGMLGVRRAALAIGIRPQQLAQPLQRQGRDVGDVVAGECHRERFATETLPCTDVQSALSMYARRASSSSRSAYWRTCAARSVARS